MDYVQDVSVFMVSCYRLQIQDGPDPCPHHPRVAMDFHGFAAKFARSQKDRTFQYRLALGLARSFATSTRFIFDEAHARPYGSCRARFLLERQPWRVRQGQESRFRLPIKELFQ